MKLLILAVIVSVAAAAPPKSASVLPATLKPLKPATTTTPKPPPRPVYIEPKPQETKMLIPMQLTAKNYENLQEVPIVRSDSNIDKNGFNYLYETGNGIFSQAAGTLKNVDNVDVISMEGQYQYPGANGEPVMVAYTADETGYHPRSDILPTPPPTPDYVYSLLKYLETHPHAE